MTQLDPSLLWVMAVASMALAFNGGIIWFQVKTTSKSNDQLRLDFHQEGERLRQDLRQHMEDEQVNMKGLLDRLDTIMERQQLIAERVARLER